MFWLAAEEFGDDGAYAKVQLKATLTDSWRLGFEVKDGNSFAQSFQNWAEARG